MLDSGDLSKIGLISATISTGLTFATNWYLNKQNYKRDYYKKIIDKRLNAYENLDNFVSGLKVAIADPDDRKMYHYVFSNEDTFNNHFQSLVLLLASSLWLSESVFNLTREMNKIYYECCKADNTVGFAKSNYEVIAALRSKIENAMAEDLLTLHNVDSFLKTKKQEVKGFERFNP